MKLGPVIAEIRRRCPIFERRVYGAAEFAAIDASTNLAVPCAYVLPLGETAEDIDLHTDYRQTVEQSFGVCVYVSTGMSDETGVSAYDAVENIKSEVLRAVAGWCPTDDVNEVIYQGASVLDLSRARLCVQLEFAVTYDIVDDETRHGVDLSELPDLDHVHMDVDLMKPDGRLEATVDIHLET